MTDNPELAEELEAKIMKALKDKDPGITSNSESSQEENNEE
jgi:hypothetical protein